MSEAHHNPVGSDPCEPSRREEPMLQEDTVQEVLRDSREGSSSWSNSTASAGVRVGRPFVRLESQLQAIR